jgi:pyruvate formate-lyase activating enzyme-like uncharacterized protein
MNEMENAFIEFLEECGKTVTILHYEGTPQKNNAGDEIPVTPMEIQTRCRIIKKQVYEGQQFNNVTLSGTYAVGLFSFDDEQYLQEDNKVLEAKGCHVIKYDIKVVEKLEGHYEVILV